MFLRTVSTRRSGKPTAVNILRLLGKILPNDYICTTFYLYAISKPRKMLRTALNGFYRMDHVYDVLLQVKSLYKGKFSILEFGTSEGHAFVKMLYATRYTKMEERVVVHAFDTFEGMPAPADRRDLNIVQPENQWERGQFKSSYDDLNAYCRSKYSNFAIRKGLFEHTLTDELLAELSTHLPILIWIDCDYYSSARTVFERILPHIPTGCVIYFDEIEFNYGSRFTGEARIVHEINTGLFGEGIELVLDRDLSWNSQRVYRFVRFEGGPRYELLEPPIPDRSLPRTNDSPLP